MRIRINPRYTPMQVKGKQWSVHDMHTGRTANVNGIVLGKLDQGMAVELANALNPLVPPAKP
ncbi:hypothetical protein ILFOPFJJ_05158 [Ensifer psoraleae]|uniref:hypothetical protein n=1 Tax=Sinorhizobium psoraleae TaxID=520838 RepID=UPI001568036C|nr:hypothetical protein [Sinorhizobium psoraleae]NRP74236.1 hypothetical protein [Sinorhizobium psoraleae]